jgi:hypothetical protein
VEDVLHGASVDLLEQHAEDGLTSGVRGEQLVVAGAADQPA